MKVNDNLKSLSSIFISISHFYTKLTGYIICTRSLFYNLLSYPYSSQLKFCLSPVFRRGPTKFTNQTYLVTRILNHIFIHINFKLTNSYNKTIIWIRNRTCTGSAIIPENAFFVSGQIIKSLTFKTKFNSSFK